MLSMIWAASFCPRWERHGGESSLGWDVSGYYWYLPSVFIYHDLKKQSFADAVLQKYEFTGTNFQQGFRLPNGNYVMKYAAGMAVMYTPFFAVAHAVAPFTGYPADGFSKPYLVAISFGSLLMAFLGLWYLRKLLLRYYEDKVVAGVLLLLVIGTNYLNYTAIDGSLSHNWLFTIYVFILLSTDNFYRTYQAKYAILTGLLCGLATLTRPTEIISLLIPLLWQMERLSFSALKDRFLLLRKRWYAVVLTALAFAAIVFIQLLYWKYVSGNWLVYSYEDQGFSWLHPHVFDYALSYKSGWIIYTPMAILFFAGIIPFLRSGKNKLAILLFFAINFYIVSAWDIWWYAGTGGRAMLQSYPVLVFLMAAFIQAVFRIKYLWILVLPVILVFAYVNIWFTVQAHGGQGLYDSECMNKEYFWKVVGRWNVEENIFKLKDSPEVFEGTPESLTMVAKDSTTECLGKDLQFSKKRGFTIKTSPGNWIRVSADFSIQQKEWNIWKMTMFFVSFRKGDQLVKENAMRVHRYLHDGDKKTLYLDIKVPEQPFDTLSVQFWNGDNDKPICINNLELFEFTE